jgi:hypothetical protein
MVSLLYRTGCFEVSKTRQSDDRQYQQRRKVAAPTRSGEPKGR